MKKILILTILSICLNTLIAQVAINTDGTIADPSSMLDVKSTTKGILVPRLTKAQRDNITSSATGLMIYQTDNTPGFYFYSGSAWVTVGAEAISINDLSDSKTGGKSVFLGANSGLNDDATDNQSVGIGDNALYFSTAGEDNTAVGYNALLSNTTGSLQTAIGNHALSGNTDGDENIAIGVSAMNSNIHGNRNIAVGNGSLFTEDNADDNVAIGYMALYQNNGGSYNVCLGSKALEQNTFANYNTAIGYKAMNKNTSGNWNVSMGALSLENNAGNGNVALGINTLNQANDASYNVTIGKDADYHNLNGDNNVIIGHGAGQGVSSHSKSGNIFLGYEAGYNETGSNKLYIENSRSGTPLIYGEFDNNLIRINGTLNINSAFSLPTADGSINQVLKTNGSGTLAWADDTNTGATNINELSDGKTGGNSVFIGIDAGKNDDGTNNINTGIGHNSMYSITTGDNNTALGGNTLVANNTGSGNVAIGLQAFYENTSGSYNTGIGVAVNKYNQTGNYNTNIGYQAGQGTTNHSKSGCVLIGYQAGFNEQTSNKLYVENSNSNSPLIYGEFDNDILTVNGRLGIGVNANIDTKLRVSHDGLYSGYFTSSNHNNATKIVRAEYTGTANHDLSAIYGDVTPNTDVNYGYGGNFLGNYMAVKAQADAGSSSGSSYGVYAISEGTAGTRYGVYGYASGSATNRYGVYGSASAEQNSYALYCDGNGVYTGTWSQSSDKKLKKNIEPIQNALDNLLLLKPSSFNYRSDEFSFMNLEKGKQIGFIAQDIEEVFPELVSTVSQPKHNGKETEIEEYKAINYIGLIPVLTQAIQEQQVIIQSIENNYTMLRDENKELKEKLSMFEERLIKLESK